MIENQCYRCYHKWVQRRVGKPKICPSCKSPYWNIPPKKIRASKEFIENSVKVIISLHDMIIEKSGGTSGIRDEAGLYNAMYRIINFQYKKMKDPCAVGAFVYQDIAKRHHFVDGNKRTAHCYAKILLFTMDYHLKLNYKEATEFILAIARDKNPKSFNEITEWIKKNASKVERRKKVVSYLKELYFDISNGE
ncbi:MAG TPA: type II toxin-antitoxin system death-on-curing family toxin [Candidatus Nanoarchaeia archaeon]|nr:type II toxin-antitoxin system death-on-curing family toxin [Candidatus Woesearchaeota archaeon]HLC37747.1 type II toxin-antitoxin system death-on-curing family toxin [Candidatus Nanoarchaeia archaeon]